MVAFEKKISFFVVKIFGLNPLRVHDTDGTESPTKAHILHDNIIRNNRKLIHVFN